MGKVFFVTNSLTGGGAERAMNLICSKLALIHKEYEITLVPINKGQSDLVEPGCRVVPIDRQWRGGFIDTFSSWLKFTTLTISERPKVIVLNCSLPELFASLVPIPANIIVVEHSRNPWSGREFIGYLVRKILKWRGAKFISVSKHLGIWSLPEVECATIVNPVFQGVRRQSNQRRKAITRLAFIGRLSADKNPHDFIEILGDAKYPGLVIGDGILLGELEELAREKSVIVNFIGHQVNPWEFLDEGDLLIVPSKFEGDGLVIVEAILGRFPLLVSDIEEFRKFQLHRFNYCTSTEVFLEYIDRFATNIYALVPSQQSVEKHERERSTASIIDSWRRALSMSMTQ
jgi:glycosyltransferase involved in cell wall biosynthesis